MQELEKKAQETGKTLPDEKSKKILKDKNENAKPEEWKPSNIAEYLFSNDRGELADDINASEIDQIYNGYMQSLVSSYEKMKGKFNTFAAKCLSEKQKRESGLLLVAPPLCLPGDKDSDTDYSDAVGMNGYGMEEMKH